MSTTTELSVWNEAEEIKKLFAPTLTDIEFQIFMGLGKKLNANPFTREIWALKYGTAAATIFCGRDFYRRKAAEQPNYDGHVVEAVYANDDFKTVNGVIQHSFNLTNRGALLAAYCIVKRKGVALDYCVKVLLSEYTTGQSNWKAKPETMIKKVAEAQALRAAFQNVFEGTYDESEETKVAQTQDGGHVVMASDQILESIQASLTEGFLTEAQAAGVKQKLDNKDNLTQGDAEVLVQWIAKQKEKLAAKAQPENVAE